MNEKIGAIVLNWNMERFLRPHLDMLLEQIPSQDILFAQQDGPWEPYAREHGYSRIPDNSEQIVLDEYPGIKVVHVSSDSSDPAYMIAHSMNQALEYMRDYDIVFRLDPDMFFTPGDWKKFVDYIRETSYSCYCLDWSTNSVDYYRDFDHGVIDQVETDPLAANPEYNYGRLLGYPGRKHILDEGIILHHLRNWKDSVDEDFIEGRKPNANGYAGELVKKYGKDGKWIRAPREIRERFK